MKTTAVIRRHRFWAIPARGGARRAIPLEVMTAGKGGALWALRNSEDEPIRTYLTRFPR